LNQSPIIIPIERKKLKAMYDCRDVLLFYARNSGELDQCVLRSVESEIAVTEIYRTPLSLANRLKQSMHDISTLVLTINDEEELDKIETFKTLLMDLPIIIILERMDKQLIKRCLRLRPRLIDGTKNAAIIEKALHSLHYKHMNAQR